MLKDILGKAIAGHLLTEHEAKRAMDAMMGGEATSSQIASLLTVLRFRGETSEEMTGFVRSMREHAITLEHNMDVMDTCGTGGDGASTFNISTATAIVLSSLDVKVAKHGNRGMSSKSGSAEVLDELGIPTQSGMAEALERLKKKNMCFLFAQQYHASMKYAASPRKEIGFKTIFNLLGPLTNPANSKRQLIGVFDTSYAENMAETLNNLGTERAVIVTGGDGIDECSITSHTDVVILDRGTITRGKIVPEAFGLKRGDLRDIQVNGIRESADMIVSVLSGHGNESATGTVLLNAGVGLYAAGKADSMAEGVQEVRKAITDGRAYDQLQTLREEWRIESHA